MSVSEVSSDCKSRMVHSQDDTVMLFSLCLSHYRYVSMRNAPQDDKSLNVTHNAGQAEMFQEL